MYLIADGITAEESSREQHDCGSEEHDSGIISSFTHVGIFQCLSSWSSSFFFSADLKRIWRTIGSASAQVLGSIADENIN